jgi:hypothetical protein
MLNFFEMAMTPTQRKYILILGGVSIFLAFGYFAFLALRKKLKSSPSGYAKQFVGEEETNANQAFKNKDFEAKMRGAGWYSGAQWCAFFVKMVFQNTLDAEGVLVAKNLISGSTQTTFSNFSDITNAYFEVSQTPKVDGIVIWQNVADKSTGHTGIVTSVSGDTFKTIEGNSNANGSQGIVNEGSYSLSAERAGRNGKKIRGFINLK